MTDILGKGLKLTESVSVTILVDNFMDVFLPDGEHVERHKLIKNNVRAEPLIAEHGLSLLIEITGNSMNHRVIMEFGVSNIAMPHNMAVLGVNPEKVEAAFISHGHHDHIGAIKDVLKLLPDGIDIMLHPDAFLPDRIRKLSHGTEIPIPSLKNDPINPSEYSIINVLSPMLLANEHIATITNIPRKTDFEKGMPAAY